MKGLSKIASGLCAGLLLAAAPLGASAQTTCDAADQGNGLCELEEYGLTGPYGLSVGSLTIYRKAQSATGGIVAEDADDNDATVFPSEAARTVVSTWSEFDVPADAQIEWALAYTNHQVSGADTEVPLMFRTSDNPAYLAVTPEVITLSNKQVLGRYDVTRALQGGEGADRVYVGLEGDVWNDQITTDIGVSIVVAYRDSAAPNRQLIVFSGLQNLPTDDVGEIIEVDGFQTFASQETTGQIAVTSSGLQADLVQNGNFETSLTIDDGSPVAVGNNINPTDNFINGLVGIESVPGTAEVLDWSQVATSVHNVVGQVVELNTDRVDQGVSELDLSIKNQGDDSTIRVHNVTVLIDVDAPNLVLAKSQQITGNDGVCGPGGSITYTLQLRNDADSIIPAADAVITDDLSQLPASVVLDETSIEIKNPNDADFRPATALDYDYDETSRQLEFFVGTGASSVLGGGILGGQGAEVVEVRFTVDIGDDLDPSAVISNRALASAIERDNLTGVRVYSFSGTLASADDTVGATGCAICQNGSVERGEQCDDGNDVDGDGCEATCELSCETADDCTGDQVCIASVVSNTTTGNQTQIGTCEDPVCGDGVISANEECDPGVAGENNCDENCVFFCVSNDDCAEGQLCNVDGDCVDDTTPECTSNDDCGTDEVCNADGECVADVAPECTDNTDCGTDEICNTDGECVADVAPECTDNTDCGDEEVCNSDGECIPANDTTDCAVDSDCSQGDICIDNRCVGNPVDPGVEVTGGLMLGQCSSAPASTGLPIGILLLLGLVGIRRRD